MQKQTGPSPNNPQDIYDLTGRTYGPITVLKLDRITKGRRYWLTRCVCGTERILAAHAFRKKPPHCEGCELIELRASGEASPQWMLDLGFDETFLIRFWPRVNKDGPVPTHMPHLGQCWIWTGGVNGKGYGSIMAQHCSDGPRLTSAHQASWAIEHRMIPTMCVLHHCDTPRCVRPDHLFLGTKADNNADRVQKGRDVHPEGEDTYNHKLTEEKVRQIRSLRLLGTTYEDLADMFHCSETLIALVVRRMAWKHVV